MFKNVHQMQKEVFFANSQELFDQTGWFDKNTNMTIQWKQINNVSLSPTLPTLHDMVHILLEAGT